MDVTQRNKSKIAELLSVAVRPGRTLHVSVRKKEGIVNYVGPVEKMDDESLTLVSGAYSLRRGVPVPRRGGERIGVYGSEIVDYAVMGPILGCVLPRWKGYCINF